MNVEFHFIYKYERTFFIAGILAKFEKKKWQNAHFDNGFLVDGNKNNC